MKKKIFLLVLLIFSCTKDEVADNKSSFFTDDSRNFYMGFTTYPYAPTSQAYIDTYQFVNGYADIYKEEIHQKIPWDAWMNNKPLPTEFTDEVYRCVNRKLKGKYLILSVSILNILKNDLAPDYDGTIPVYTKFSDTEIENAYFKHVKYLVDMIQPNYLIYGTEINELYINNYEQWESYKVLMSNVRERLKIEFPNLPMAESISLHFLYQSNFSDKQNYQDEIFAYINQMDFIPVSFYPFLKDLKTTVDFQNAFDYLYQHVTKPIAFSKTGMNAENIDVDTMNLHIIGNEDVQNEYLKILFLNAQKHKFKFVIWWTHRDYYQTWLSLPSDEQDLRKICLSCGLLKEDATYRKAYTIWKEVLEVTKKHN